MKRFLFRLIIIFIIILEMGWTSNFVTSFVVRYRLSQEIMPQDRGFWVLVNKTAPHHSGFYSYDNPFTAYAIFKLAGGSCFLNFDEFFNYGFFGYPWYYVNSPNWIIPFYIQIEYGGCVGPLAGYGEYSEYITFFGYYHQLSRGMKWVS